MMATAGRIQRQGRRTGSERNEVFTVTPWRLPASQRPACLAARTLRWARWYSVRQATPNPASQSCPKVAVSGANRTMASSTSRT
ncbi:hypothetical protein ACFQ0B_04930 [Nonomuraea thailandensis]